MKLSVICMVLTNAWIIALVFAGNEARDSICMYMVGWNFILMLLALRRGS